MCKTSVQAAIKKLAKQPTASSSPAKFQKTVETDDKQSATAVSEVADRTKRLSTQLHLMQCHHWPLAKAKAFWQAAAAMLEESTPAEHLSMTRQVPIGRCLKRQSM